MNHQVSEEHQHHQQQGLLQTGEGKVLTSIRGRRRGKRRASSEVARGLDGGEEVKEVKEEEEEKEEKTGGQKQEEEEEEEEEITTTTNGRRRKRAPKDWEKVWEGVSERRARKDAPVDTMGCEVLAEEDAEPKVRRYHTLISLMLSSQTRDQQTAAAIRQLQQHGLTVENILSTSEKDLSELISNVSFYRNKAKFIKRTTEILHEEYDDDIPGDYEGLLKLPGVGPKMAHLTLQCAWNKTEGIGVDVHVHRISNRLGWVQSTKTPEATRKELEEWLPFEYWNKINLLFVGFGQTICTPRNPKCPECKVNNLCPEGRKALQKHKRQKKTKSNKDSGDENNLS